jgi:hypothetical protein
MMDTGKGIRPVKVRHHIVWDKKVRKISGGLTIHPVAKGQWVSPEDELFCERMIPVRVMAYYEQMDEIINFTIKHYHQRAVLAYRVSNWTVLRYKKEGKELHA